MELIKYDNLKWLYSVLDTNEEVNEVSEYLKEHDLCINLKETRDRGMTGENMMLEGIDLSGNGYCFKGQHLLDHVRHYRERKLIAQTDEYKQFLVLRDKYEDMYRALNR